jgi:hypothetical protein
MLEEIVEKVLHCFNGKSSAGLRNACENYRTTGDEPQKLGRHAAAVWLLMRTLIDVEQENENLKQEVLNLKQGHGAPATQSAEGAKRGDVEAKSTEQLCTAVQMPETVETRDDAVKTKKTADGNISGHEVAQAGDEAEESKADASDEYIIDYKNLMSKKAKNAARMSYGKLLKSIPKFLLETITDKELGAMSEKDLRREVVKYWELQKCVGERILKYFNDRIPQELSGKIHHVYRLRGTREKNVLNVLFTLGWDKMRALLDMYFGSNFLMGMNGKGWVADFNWLFRGDNYIKVLEGRYNKLYQHTQTEYLERQKREAENVDDVANSPAKKAKIYRRSVLKEEIKSLRGQLKEEREMNTILVRHENVERYMDGHPSWMRGYHPEKPKYYPRPDTYRDEQPRNDEEESILPPNFFDPNPAY